MRRLPEDGEISFKSDGYVMVLSCGRSRYRVPFLPAEDFPEAMAVAEGERLLIPAADLSAMLRASAYATTVKDSRVFTGGVYLHAKDGRLACVGSDGSRLGLRSCALEVDDLPSMVIPTDGARELERLLGEAEGDVDLLVSDSKLELHLPRFRFTTKLLDCTYPLYERVIPKANGACVTVGRDALLAAVERAHGVLSTVGNANSLSARLSVEKDRILVTSGPKEASVVHEEVEEVEADGAEDTAFSLNLGWLAEMLRLWPQEARIAIQSKGHGSAIRFSSEDDPGSLHVIMPAAPGRNED